jgi:hypothetical protein
MMGTDARFATFQSTPAADRSGSVIGTDSGLSRPSLAVGILIAGSLTLVAGTYEWAGLTIVAGALALALWCRDSSLQEAEDKRFDWFVFLVLAAIALQLVPLPFTVLGAISPGTIRFGQLYRLLPGDRASGPGAAPISVAPITSVCALAITIGVALAFWGTRRIVARDGPRQIARHLSWIGMAFVALTIVQRRVAPSRLLGVWMPETFDADVFGPFVNRNHFAAWLVMALPLSVGYLISRTQAPMERDSHDRWWIRIARCLDPRSIGLMVAISTMASGVFLSVSRSALAGLVCGLVICARGDRKLLRRTVLWPIALAFLVPVVLGGAMFAGGVSGRVERMLSSATPELLSRTTIWRETMPALQDFWPAGSGAGTYSTTMLLYQASFRPTVYFSQAHNHYLHLAVEGGVLLVVPVALLLVAFVRLARRRLTCERYDLYWIRRGAAAGLVGIAVQSLWETGLRMPANAILAAVLAAILVAPVTSSNTTGQGSA